MNLRTAITIGLAASLCVACSESGSDPDRATAEDVGKEASEALGALGDYAAGKRDELMGTLEKQYEAIKPRIDDLVARGGKLKDGAEIELTERLQALDKKRAQFEQKLAELRDASGDAARELSAGAQSAWAELQSAYTEAAKRFTEHDPAE